MPLIFSELDNHSWKSGNLVRSQLMVAIAINSGLFYFCNAYNKDIGTVMKLFPESFRATGI
jgi:hypothetical protein